jgi:leader peptidase (prepilin peptidase)/N-methyltransferase
MFKCRKCKGQISLRYFFVELMTAILFLAVYKRFGIGFQSFTYWILVGLILVATYIDLDFQIIPDEISIGGLIAGITLSFIFPQVHNKLVWWHSGLEAIMGAALGGIMLQTVRYLGSLAFRKEAMGFGDIKFLAMIGSFLGWELTVLVFFVSPVIGSIVGLFVILFKKEHIVPYGPFLTLGSLIAMFWGQYLWEVFFRYSALVN